MRLIDSDALLKRWNEMTNRGRTEFDQEIILSPIIKVEPNSCKYWDSESHFCAIRKPQAEPVRCGHWIDIGSGQECSACREIQYGYDNYRYYCQFCGAKME